MEETPQSVLDLELEDESSEQQKPSSFGKKFVLVMGLEVIVAAIALSYFLHVGFFANQSTLARDIDPQGSNKENEVLGAKTVNLTPKIIYKVITPTPSPTPIKKTYKIAIIGDSFEDTMGETGEYLQKSLKTKYPETEFLIYNYGKGATTVKDGLESFDKEFKYGIRNYPAVPDLKPDIIIVGSYANNPPNPYDRNWHWLTYTQLIQKVQKVTPNVYILAEVAPLRAKYGDGPNGVNWEDDYATIHSGHVIELMENVIGLAKALNVPLIDAYTPSLDKDSKNGKEGKKEDISVSDGIHPSQDGHEFIAKTIAESIKLN